MSINPIIPRSTQVTLSTTSKKVLEANVARQFLDLKNLDDTIAMTFSLNGDFAVPANEIQTITFDAPPTAGTFKLTLGANETGAINWNDAAADVEDALELLAGIGEGQVAVTGSIAAGLTVEFEGTLANTPQVLLQVTSNSLVDDTTETNEVQRVDFSLVPDTGVWALGFKDSPTADLAFNISSGDLQTAIQAVPGCDGVTVAGDFAGGFVFTFAGAQAAAPWPLLQVLKNELTLNDDPQDEVQTIEFTPVPTAGTFKLAFGDDVTPELTFDASAVLIQTELENLPSIGAGNVTVTGDFTDGFTVTFVGALAALSQTLLNPVPVSRVENPYIGTYGLTTGQSNPQDVLVVVVETTAGHGPSPCIITPSETTLGVGAAEVNGLVVETQTGVLDLPYGDPLPALANKAYELAVPVTEVWAKAASGNPILEITEA